jgi:anti-sigma B factor antagonist
MNIDFLIEGEVAIVKLEGKFTTGSDAEFLRVKQGLADSGKHKIVVDCSQVPYLDSTALNFLVGLYTTAKNSGGGFALCGVNQRMCEVLRITHLNEFIPIHETRQSAITSLTQRSDGVAEG